MSRADLIAKRDAAAEAYEIALTSHHENPRDGVTYRLVEATRKARTVAQDAVDAADKAPPDPGGPCPKCGGEGGHFAEECPSITTEWIECEACEGTGEYWPEDATS